MRSIDAFLDILGYRASWAGIVRIALWTVLFLWLAGLMIPERARQDLFSTNVAGLPISPMITLESDPAFIRDVPLPEKGKHFRIAWISDSSSILYKPGAKLIDLTKMGDHKLLAVKTLEALRGLGLANAHIDLFLRVSLRCLETYTLTKLALERHPDLLIISVSPVFIFNNHAVFKGDSHFAKASAVWGKNIDTWPWLFLMPSPADHLWALLTHRFTVFSQAPVYAEEIDALKHDFWTSLFPPLKNTQNGEKEDSMTENSLVFWVIQRYLKGDLSVLLNDKNETVNSKWYRQVIRLSDFGENSFNHRIVRKTLETLKNSGVKAIIYIEQASQAMKDDPGAWAIYQHVKDTFRAYEKEYGSDKIRFIIDVPPDVLAKAVYVTDDDIHFEQEGDMDKFLAQQIFELSKEPEGTKNEH